MWGRNNSSDSTIRLMVPEKMKLAPGEVLLDLEEDQIASKTKVASQLKSWLPMRMAI